MNPIDAGSTLKHYDSESGYRWQRNGPVRWQRELDGLEVSLADFPSGVDQACEMNPPGHVVKPPPRRAPIDLTDIGLRIASWPTRDTPGTIDATELHRKTAALVEALKAVEVAADAMPSGLRKLLGLRVEAMGRVVIGEAESVEGVEAGDRLLGVQRTDDPTIPREVAHVVAIFDDHAAIQVWRHERWNYEIIEGLAIRMGLWTPERDNGGSDEHE